MRKILIITDNLKDQINGVVTTFKNIEAYASIDHYSFVYLDPGQFNYINCPGYPEVKLSFPYKIGKKIKEIDPDYIHIATEGPLGFAARCWLDKNRWKYNTSYHTKFPDFLKQIYGIPKSITYNYVRWFHKHSGKVLTTTQTMVNDLRENGFQDNIIPWTRGVDRKVFKSSLRLKNNKTVLLSVGRISKEKGLDDFCELNYPNSVKIIVGDGPYRKDLEERYPNIQFVGIKRGLELSEYYAQADVFVFTSRTDTFGIVIIESLACGTPVAAYSVPGPIDILENGITGYMGNNLVDSITRCLELDRKQVEINSNKWSWKNCWEIFRDNLVNKN
jgi:glycosyltransferase involved in cell wall biosynthesis